MLLEVLDEDMLHAVLAALDEDIGSGDITAALIPQAQMAQASVICRESAVVCGQAWFNAVFAELDDRVSVNWLVRDGDSVQNRQTLCTLNGPARPILSGERTALNFLQTLSATATIAHRQTSRSEFWIHARPSPACASPRNTRCALVGVITIAAVYMTPS